MAGGDLDARMAPSAYPDLAPVVTSFNGMVDSLRARIERERRLVGEFPVDDEIDLARQRVALEIAPDRQPLRMRTALQEPQSGLDAIGVGGASGLLRVTGGAVEPVKLGLKVGYPAGIALTADEA